jgi:hypothetical protein
VPQVLDPPEVWLMTFSDFSIVVLSTRLQVALVVPPRGFSGDVARLSFFGKALVG